ncbi:MAG TPA: PKD domain-containing protein, partial [Chitinophagaceae bacterium]|nr:PKD domain-containing protein [Chitinophagaceae bacterium]
SPVIFTDQSPAATRPITTYSWDFGDNTTAAIQNPSHQYTNTGTYTVKFSLITDVGCLSDTVQQTVKISVPPIANFSPQGPVCETKQVTLADQSTVTAGNTLVKWSWDLGDGTTLSNTTNASVQHTYPGATSYNVSLQVQTNTGCKSAVKTVALQVHSLPVPDFSLPRVCLTDPVAEFDDSSSIADHSEASFTWLWDFGDGGSSTQKNGQHKYATTGLKNVKLTVTSKDGCVADTTKSFTVNGTQPVADFSLSTPDPLCSNKAITLLDHSSVNIGSIIKVEIYWDYFNDPTKKTVDNNPVPGQSYSYKYAAFGTPLQQSYQVRYYTYSGPSCISTPPKMQVINLDASPKVQFDTLLPVCAEVPAFQLTAARDIYGLAGAGVYSGAGISAAGLFSPTVAAAGTHLITYIYSASNGCADTAARNIVVYPTPQVDAGPDRFLLEGGSVVLEATASGN